MIDLDKLITFFAREGPANLEEKLRIASKVLLHRNQLSDLPRTGETFAIATHNRKTAALFFDRVWFDPLDKERVPAEIASFGNTDIELALSMAIAAKRLGRASSGRQVFPDFFYENPKIRRALQESVAERGLATAIFDDHQLAATPIYRTADARNLEYRPGDVQALVAAIDGLQIVDDKALDWQQVVEFRADRESQQKFRRMRNWLDRELVGKSTSFVADAIAVKLSDYEWALRKHGIQHGDRNNF